MNITPTGGSTPAVIRVHDGLPGPQGPAGPSAYDLAVANGYTGTQTQWLDSLAVRGLRRRDLPHPAAAERLYSGTAPTISIAQTSTPTSGYIMHRPPGVTPGSGEEAAHLTLLGATNFQVGDTFPDTTYILPTSRYPHTRDTYASSQSTWSLAFATDAADLQVRVNYQASGHYRLSIDGQPLTHTMTPLGGATAGYTHLLSIDFGGAAHRTIRLDFSAVPFGGIYLPPGATLWPAPPTGGRLAVLGDSLSDGSAENTGAGAGTWVHHTARQLAAADTWNQSRGGTGYIASGTWANFPDRITDITDHTPDRVIVWGGYNDSQEDQAALAAAVDTTLAALTSALPDAAIYVIGCWDPTGTPGATITGTDTTLRGSAATAGIPFISPITGSIYTADGTLADTHGPWITTANQAAYIGSDNVHPNDDGHAYLARRITAAIAALLPA
ncbi:SGNH/GDSL hydrolase family protein [Streptomyces sp. JJ66]|uniref:SGNH/GDSL hydrolase family protein n=1 Tax=Streptomyces sp. JJ66 TaxID=2803843 RepID=UPI001C575645|nr:SGNH/GDSL hydrolase family protein [Streptomyces sp. JJ66]MBW1600882.1 SGNH/GDSL hydrolase family protein [Streptomyces sp. JJ66]